MDFKMMMIHPIQGFDVKHLAIIFWKLEHRFKNKYNIKTEALKVGCTSSSKLQVL